MITYYSVTRKIKSDFEKKLEELSSESRWAAVRALVVALELLVIREIVLNSNSFQTNSNSAPPEWYVDSLPFLALIFFIVFLLSVKKIRNTFKENIFDWDEIGLGKPTEKKINKSSIKLSEINSELKFMDTLFELTNKNKVKKAGALFEDGLSSMLDDLEHLKSFCTTLNKKKPHNTEQLQANLNSTIKDFEEFQSKLSETGVDFSKNYLSKIDAATIFRI